MEPDNNSAPVEEWARRAGNALARAAPREIYFALVTRDGDGTTVLSTNITPSFPGQLGKDRVRELLGELSQNLAGLVRQMEAHPAEPEPPNREPLPAAITGPRDILNHHFVSCLPGRGVVVQLPPLRVLSVYDAVLFAAWLVAVADTVGNEDATELYEALSRRVRTT